MKKEMIDKLHTEEWSIHFDGKHIEENEYQVVVLKNERTEIRLGALCLKDGKAETITDGIVKLLDEHNLWRIIKTGVANPWHTMRQFFKT